MRLHFMMFQLTIASGVLTALGIHFEEYNLAVLNALMFVSVVFICFWKDAYRKKMHSREENNQKQ